MVFLSSQEFFSVLVQIADPWGPGGAMGSVGSMADARAIDAVTEPVDLANIDVRPARIADMRAVEPMIRAFANDNLMLPKTSDQLARTFREFVVAIDGEGRIVGCGALRIYTEGLAEICSLAVDGPFQGHGIGKKLVEGLVAEAKVLELQKVFALTLKPGFFEALGFSVVSKEDFPLKVWADCRSCPKLHACDEIAVALEI